MVSENMTAKAKKCKRHPAVETSLLCSKCETPICPKCGISTPVGMRCPECATSGKSPLFQPSFLEAIKVGAVALGAGVVGSWIFISGLGFYTLFLSFAYGYAVGEAVLRVGKRKRGWRVEITAALGITIGALGTKALGAWMGQGATGLIGLFSPLPIFPIALVIAIVSAISRIRYL